MRGPIPVICGVCVALLCANLLVPVWRWHLLFGYSHEPVRDLAGVVRYTQIPFPPGTRFLDGEIVDSLSSGSAIFARVVIPRDQFSSFSKEPRYENVLRQGNGSVGDYTADLWPEVRSRWNLPFTGRGVAGGRKFADPGFVAREDRGAYTVFLWEWH